MDAPETALRGQNTTAGGRLYMAFELGEKSWKLSLGDGQRAPSRCTVAAGATTAVLIAIANARARCHLSADTPVYNCYEGGRDGLWLHRWLTEQRIANLVVDSTSIEVSRMSRLAKTNRLDSDKLLSMLMRYHSGEGRVWAVVRIPAPVQEDRAMRREPGCLSMTPTPYASGTSKVELGVSQAGNRRCRWLMVERFWSWLRL
jgi:transposase